MKIEFKDFYGQHVLIHNNTGSGNLRIKVGTCKNLNDTRNFSEIDKCPVQTDISLTPEMVNAIVAAVQMEERE